MTRLGSALVLVSLGIFPLMEATTVREAFGQHASPKATKQAATPSVASPAAEMIRAEAEMIKAEAERKKIEIEEKKFELENKRVQDGREQFFYNLIFKAAVLVIGGLLLLILIPKVLPLLKKVGLPGFIELELRDALTSVKTIVRIMVPERSVQVAEYLKPARQTRPPDGQAKYEYERVTWHLYRLFEEIDDPNSLDAKAKDQLRSIIKNAYFGAATMEHRSKALDIILYLKKFADRDLDAEEMLTIGKAHIWAATDQNMDQNRRRDIHIAAIPYCSKAYYATRITASQASAAYHYGLALLMIDDYRKSISWMTRCIALDEQWRPWSAWAIACAEAKLGRRDLVISNLESIQRNLDFTDNEWIALWKEIEKDDYFSVLSNTPEDHEFRRLLARKRSGSEESNYPVAPDPLVWGASCE